MELSAKYAYKIYKEKSFSAAAKALYISQPALSACIARLEKELGIVIFDRTKIPLTLTPQGRIYIQAIEEIMESESNMRRKLYELSDMSFGALTIGGSSYASYYLMSEICGEFYKKYPKIKVTLDIGNIGDSEILWEKFKNNEIDLMLTYSNDRSGYIFEPIYSERLVIAMHKDMKGASDLKHLALTHHEVLSGNYPKCKEIEDLSIFDNIPFIDYERNVDVARRMRQMFGDYKVVTYAIKDARHSEMHYNLMCAGIGAVMTTDSAIVQKQHNAEDILFFIPKNKETYRTIYIARKYSTSDNTIINNFMEIARTYYKVKEHE